MGAARVGSVSDWEVAAPRDAARRDGGPEMRVKRPLEG
ncbi:hypothetical protein CfE428DRAFT_6036 [Chthoniobacter flavus Ellin428]|uniref:Uncharacterized protein n=1 Tax=Chthoniobacter flavus Ellin428 TaxID=497964 RepID=B4DAU5_9BACT|nr:hypothetical protein CfE428DRAFT_6036 [Chthoniobacter flavus Ellin428]